MGWTGIAHLGSNRSARSDAQYTSAPRAGTKHMLFVALGLDLVLQAVQRISLGRCMQPRPSVHKQCQVQPTRRRQCTPCAGLRVEVCGTTGCTLHGALCAGSGSGRVPQGGAPCASPGLCAVCSMHQPGSSLCIGPPEPAQGVWARLSTARDSRGQCAGHMWHFGLTSCWTSYMPTGGPAHTVHSVPGLGRHTGLVQQLTGRIIWFWEVDLVHGSCV